MAFVVLLLSDSWWQPPWRWSQSTKRDSYTTARQPTASVSPR
uniref:Integrin subunit alpha D n=1 Tax=Sus scrofa TaxID=9823 RepID=A0ABB5UPX9_PIG